MSATLATMLPGDSIRISTDPCTETFWKRAQEHKLTACQCAACGHFRMPPRPYCPECQSRDIHWPELPGTGTVYSFVVCHKSPFTGEDLTYVPVVVDLDGAGTARLVSNLIDIDPDDVKIGMKVKVAWHPITDGWVLPIFRPA